MSIRYTLRHNIPASKLEQEDVNDSSTWNLDLLRKHELAETDDYDIVYRQHDGKVVSWAEAATQQSQAILKEVQGVSANIDEQVQAVEAELEEVEAVAVTLTQEAEEANEAAQQAVAQSEQAVGSASLSASNALASATLAREWATKTDGLVDNNDYSAKYYASLAATSESNASASATNAQSYANTAVSAKNDAATAKNIAQTAATSAEDAKTAAEAARDDIQAYYGIPVGYEYFTINPNIPRGSLPLFGGEYSRDTYADLWAWVQEQTGYLKTEAQWQALSSANAGNVPYYSDGDGSTTFRVPSLKCWVKSANGTVSEIGSYLQAGVPNIQGMIASRLAGDTWLGWDTGGGAFYSQGDTASTFYESGHGKTSGKYQLGFDASRSNSIYGNSATVQPPSIVGMWLVKAYGVVEDTGSIDEQQYLDDRMADLKNVYLPANYLPLSGGTMSGVISFSNNGVLQNVHSGNGGQFSIQSTSDGSTGAYITLHGENYSALPGQFRINAVSTTYGKKTLAGTPAGSLTWDGQPIQTSSDKRLKQDFSAVPAEVLEAWGKVNWQQFKYKADVERKGENCRFHTGLVAQDVKEVGEENNVDLLKYGILCHDVREATEDSEAVDLWTVRYEEALAMEVIYLRNEIKKLREEIKALRTE